MCTLLAAYNSGNSMIAPTAHGLLDNFMFEAKNDVRRVLEILEQVGTISLEMAKTRTDVLRMAYESIPW
jgi:hypothetical protein